MNYIDLGVKDPGATEKVVFDFLSLLAVGETLSGATTTAAVWTGVDATPGGLISGAATVSGSQATQALTGGVAGVIYKLTCTATTSAGQTLVLTGYIAVVADPV